MVENTFQFLRLTIHLYTGNVKYLTGNSFSILFINFSGYAEDALSASHMNVKPGGKQPKMRAGWFKKGCVRFIQHMVFEGLPKGLKQVCLERFGEDMIKGKMKN